MVCPDFWALWAQYSGRSADFSGLGLAVRLGPLPLADLVLRCALILNGRAAAQRPGQLGVADKHLPRLRALVPRDHAAALEHVDQASGSGIAHAQAPLDHRDGGRAA